MGILTNARRDQLLTKISCIESVTVARPNREPGTGPLDI